jgi:uncharacterized protein with GYD domain
MRGARARGELAHRASRHDSWPQDGRVCLIAGGALRRAEADFSVQRFGAALNRFNLRGPMGPRRNAMATYIALSNFTDQGIRSVKDTTKRAEAAAKAAKRFGVKMTQIYWTVGSFDLVIVIEAPDDASATAFMLSTGSAGNVRTQTLRAFSKSEMNGILGKLK